MRRTVPPSAEIEDQIDELLAVRSREKPREVAVRARQARRQVDHPARCGGRVRRLARQGALRALGPIINGACATAFAPGRFRPARASCRWGSRRSGKPAEPFVWKLARGADSCAPEPLKAMVIGAFVRGLSMRDVVLSLCGEKAAAGRAS